MVLRGDTPIWDRMTNLIYLVCSLSQKRCVPFVNGFQPYSSHIAPNNNAVSRLWQNTAWMLWFGRRTNFRLPSSHPFNLSGITSHQQTFAPARLTIQSIGNATNSERSISLEWPRRERMSPMRRAFHIPNLLSSNPARVIHNAAYCRVLLSTPLTLDLM
jgi:hypothetical protein